MATGYDPVPSIRFRTNRGLRTTLVPAGPNVCSKDVERERPSRRDGMFVGHALNAPTASRRDAMFVESM